MNQHTGSAIYKITNPLHEIPKPDRPKGCYIYIHRRATDGTPFYVGKGIGPRAWRLYNRSKHHHNCSIKNGVTVEIYKDGLTSDEACELEKDVIEKVGFDNLVNISTGGESGAIGITPHNIRAVECSNGVSFKSAKLAAKWLGKKDGSMITACCKGKIKSAWGYDWRYEGDIRDFHYLSRGERIGKTQGYTVARSDGEIYESASDAGRKMSKLYDIKIGTLVAYIAKSCREGGDYLGYKWEYIKKGA